MIPDLVRGSNPMGNSFHRVPGCQSPGFSCIVYKKTNPAA